MAARLSADVWTTEVRRRLQRKMARQKMGSKSREKTVTQLAKHSHQEQIRNRNELHRITSQLDEEVRLFRN